MTSDELLMEWCRYGWRYRGIGRRSKLEQTWYAERVQYELGLIIGKEFSDFFLATSDMVRWAKDNGIPVGPGRGSVAASVVAWLLRITEVDPHRYQGMLFERFIDVSRADPPDIDLDISDERRHEVFDYMARKYGADCVGTVGNFVRYRGKNSLADIARVYRIPIGAKETVAGLLIERSGGDSRFDASLEDTVQMFPNAKTVFDQFPDFWKACRLEGNVRGMSVHAAGMIVANSPLTDICAVYERDGRRILSIDKYDVEYCNALKMDMLGLATMGMIARCLEMIDLELEDLYAVPDTDNETLRVFKRGDVVGIFQFEGRATRLVNRDVSPDNFLEVADINALSRPGPLFSGTTAEYVDVKFGRRKPERFHPLVDEYTANTKGQIVYQEQILQILREIGGFDWFSVGQIRRIISKKLGEAAFQMSYQSFADGAKARHGIDAKLADRIWRRLVTSGTYSFNIAHAISYSTLAWWCAYLKAHYPTEFFAASLAKAGDAEAQYKLMRDAIAHDIRVYPPQLKHSRRTWTAVPGMGVVAGWQQVPGFGEKMAERIESEGPYDSYYGMVRVPGIGPKKIEALQAFATASDPFGLHRTEQKMQRTLRWLRKQHRVPYPTHDGSGLAAIHVEQNYGANARKSYGKGPRIVYAGLVKEINYQDAVENRRSRTGEEADKILASLKRPDLLAYCSIRCYDTTDEEVYVRVNRFAFPRWKRTIEGITPGHDVLVVVGNRIAGFGTPVMAERLYVIDPD